MENSNGLSSRYMFIGMILEIVVALALVLSCVHPWMRARYAEGPHALGKPSLAEIHAETTVSIASVCIGAAVGMVAGYKVFTIRRRRREVR